MSQTKSDYFFKRILSTPSSEIKELRKDMVQYYKNYTEKSGSFMSKKQGIAVEIEELCETNEKSVDID